MHLTIISGSHRIASQSIRISNFLKERVLFLSLFNQIDILDLAKNHIPLWNEDIWSEHQEWTTVLTSWRTTLRESDAFIIVTPEWNGMVPSSLKNFFLIFGAKDLGHKPALIVAISSSFGGAYPIIELRTSSYKNCHICYIPDHLIIRHVQTVFQHNVNIEVDQLQDRVDYTLKVLKEYSTGLRFVRNSGIIDHQTFRNGM